MNVTPECDNLDAYLADDLPDGAATRFARHLAECEACREAIEQQQWIDGLLNSAEATAQQRAPHSLHDAFRTSIARRRQSARLIACGLAAAGTVAIVAVGWTVKLNRQAENARVGGLQGLATNVDASGDTSYAEFRNSAPAPRAMFVSAGDSIAVPLASGDDDVTVVQLYPTTNAERRWRRDVALQITYSDPNGG